jgi:hypothetical protein
MEQYRALALRQTSDSDYQFVLDSVSCLSEKSLVLHLQEDFRMQLEIMKPEFFGPGVSTYLVCNGCLYDMALILFPAPATDNSPPLEHDI